MTTSTKTTKTTATSKFTGIYKGFVYKDFVGGELLTVEKVTDDSIIFNNGLEVTSLDAFRLVERNYDVEDLSSRKFEAEDGELFMDGVQVETGTLYVEEVLYATGSLVGLKVRSLQKGKFDFFIYNFVQDRFTKTEFVFEKILENEEKIDNIRVLRLYNEETITIPADEVDVSQLRDDMHYSNYGDTYKFGYAYEFLVVLQGGSLNGSLMLLPAKKSELVVFGEELVLVQQSKLAKEALSFNDNSFNVSVDNDRIVVTEVVITPVMDSFGDEEKSLVDTEVNVVHTVLRKGDTVEHITITDSNYNSLLITTEKGFIYSNNGYNPRHAEGKVAKEAVKDYPYFIRLEAGTQRNVFTLANDKRETIKVEVVKTQDRGYTTNII